MLKWAGGASIVLVIGLFLAVAAGSVMTERDIRDFQSQIRSIAAASATPAADPAALNRLPEPLQRYIDFAFPEKSPSYKHVELAAEGQFRRPLTDEFNHTTAEQVIAAGEPALMFSATTPIVPGIWARAYDFFAQGEMEMKAKIVSLLTGVDEQASPELNVISLRRWLLESPLYPQALLPGGPVSWEAIDKTSARAIVANQNMQASMIVHIDEAGQITHMVAEENGDLGTPYHGSGEHVTRSDYKLIEGQMIPMKFVISRASDGEIHPFWDGRVTSISFY